MKTTVSIKILAILAASCAQAFALTYFAGKRNPETQEEKNMKYSTCYWGSSGDFETPPLPSKPGVNDTLATRWGWGYKLDIDANIQDVYKRQAWGLSAQKPSTPRAATRARSAR